MHYTVTLKLIFLIFISLISPKILATTERDFFPYYIGADIQIRKMPFKQGFGDDLFKKESTQGNFYLGFKVNKYFGIEVGHQIADKKQRDSVVPETSRLGQVPRTNAERGTIGYREIGTRQIKGWNLNLVGFLPVSVKYKTSLIGMVGLSSLEVKLKDVLVIPIRGINPYTLSREVKFKQRKSVLRFGGGVQKIFSDAFGVRATVVWESTSRFNNITKDYLGRTYTAKLKNSLIYGVGAFIMF